MVDPYRNVDSTRRFIQQQEISLTPNEQNNELPQAYSHYVTACAQVNPEQLTPEDAARMTIAPRYAPSREDDAAAVISEYMDAHGLDTASAVDDYQLADVQDDIAQVLDGTVRDAFPTLDRETVHQWEQRLYRRYAERSSIFLKNNA